MLTRSSVGLRMCISLQLDYYIRKRYITPTFLNNFSTDFFHLFFRGRETCMSKKLVPLFVTLLIVIASTGGVARSRSGNARVDTTGMVTFQLNMRVQMLEGKFLPASNDSV